MVPLPPFDHVVRLTDDRGIFEHAKGITPRLECGYCTDDVARALVVVCREAPLTADLERLAELYLRFVIRSQAPDGSCHNRLNHDNQWEDLPTTGDWWGRALWGLGTAAARFPEPSVRRSALDRFDISAARRSDNLHSMAFACLGAGEVLAVHPGHRPALGLLTDFVPMVGRPNLELSWPWPQPRLHYASAAIAEALIIAGWGLSDDAVLADGLGLLGWLLDRETVDGHLSVTPSGGRAEGDPQPAFDQQPIEAAAIADACARALALTGDQRWATGLDRAVGWFLGDNDAGLPLYDEATGGGFDALTPDGRNTNQGAESTLAMVATLQHGHRLTPVG